MQRGDAVVQQQAGQAAGGAGQQQPLMHLVAREPGAAALEQPHALVGIPAAGAHPLATKRRHPAHGITGRLIGRVAGLGDGPDRRRQRAVQPLIGVDAEHPGAGGRSQCALFLRAEAGPVSGADDARAVLAGQRGGAVAAG